MRTIASRFLYLLTFLSVLLVSCGERRDPKVYRIARDPTWHPLSLRGKARNLLAFSNELLVEIAREGGFRYELANAAPLAVLDGLDRGFFDAALSTREPNAILSERFAFSEPFFFAGPVLVVRESLDVVDLKEMSGKVIGIRRESQLMERAKDYPSIRIKTYQNINDALEELDKNEIDGVILNFFPALSVTQGLYAGRLKIAVAQKDENGIRLVTKHDPKTEGLIKRFNKGLQAVKENGTYEKLLKKWGLLQ